MDEVLTEFSKLLRMRLESGMFTTEDSVRYTFFHILVSKARIQPHEIILEYPHPNRAGTKIDAYIASSDIGPLAIEFKYDRDIPSQQAIPKPQNAGELFKDMERLACLVDYPSIRPILVYLAHPLWSPISRIPKMAIQAFLGFPRGRSSILMSPILSESHALSSSP